MLPEFILEKVLNLIVLKKVAALTRLYRPDVPVIIFLGAFAGRVFTTGFSIIVVYESFFLALFPYNFVYTLNSITDIVEDSINKPWRPLPSGSITKKEALLWLIGITVISVGGIAYFFKGIELFLAYLIIFLGFSYSLPPLVLKKRPLWAPFITGWGVVHPLFITGGMILFSFSLSLMLHAVGTTTLKDLSDIEGDKKAGRRVLSDRIGMSGAVSISLVLKMCSIFAFQFTQYKIAAVIPAVSIIVILYNYYFKREFFAKLIYKRTIWTTALFSVLIIFYIKLS